MTDRPRPKIPWNIFILAFVAFASGFGQDMITPVLPGFLVLLGISNAQIGLIGGLLDGATNIFRFVSGFATDRTKSKKSIVFVGYLVSSVVRPLLALTAMFLPIAALRTLDGVGKGTKDAPRDALIAESAAAAESGRAFGFSRMVDTAGSVAGPLTAFLLLLVLGATLTGYRTVFALSAIPGAVAVVLVWFGVREAKKKVSNTSTRDAHKLPWTFWAFTLTTTIAWLTKMSDALFLVRAQTLGIPLTLVPLLFGGFTLLYAAASYPIGIWSDRIGKVPLLAAGWLLMGVVEFGFSSHPSLALTLTLFAGYGLFFALTEGSARAFIADAVQGNHRGKAYGIYYTAVGLALIVGGYVLGHVWDIRSPALAFQISSVGSLAAGVAFALLVKPMSRRRV